MKNFKDSWVSPYKITGNAAFKCQPEDFQVNEVLPLVPDHYGEHLYLHIEKTACNTQWLATELARLAGIPANKASWSGLKDRHGVCRQYFSLHLPGKKDPDFSQVDTREFRILDSFRHRQRLRIGTHEGNEFKIVIREFSGDKKEFENQLTLISKEGFANYFGPQRFGHSGNNLVKLQDFVKKMEMPRRRPLRSTLISSARSFLFNQVLSARIKAGNWREHIQGDPSSIPTGPLYGDGRACEGQLQALESELLSKHKDICQWLSLNRSRAERRPLLIKPRDMTWQWLDDSILEISFSLPPGSYATSLLGQAVTLEDKSAYSPSGNNHLV